MEFLLKIGIFSNVMLVNSGDFEGVYFSELNPKILAKLYVAELNSSTHQRHNAWIFQRELGILEATIHWWKL